MNDDRQFNIIIKNDSAVYQLFGFRDGNIGQSMSSAVVCSGPMVGFGKSNTTDSINEKKLRPKPLIKSRYIFGLYPQNTL